MRLSEIKGENTMKIIADLVEYIGKIAMDKKARALFVPSKDSKLPKAEAMLQRVFENLPYLLRTHEKDLYSIFAILNNMEYGEYIKQTGFIQIKNDLTDIFTDDMFKELFLSAKPNVEEKQ